MDVNQTLSGAAALIPLPNRLAADMPRVSTLMRLEREREALQGLPKESEQ